MEIKLAIGLGNPGPEYENTYHNVGQLFIDEVAGLPADFVGRRRLRRPKADSASVATLALPKLSAERRSAKGAAGKAKAGETAFKKEKYFEYIKKREVILVKTLSFMNQSGGAVTAAKRYFDSEPGKILVIHDDSDIPLGSFKLSFGRGSAGYQGIESIIRSLRTNKFYRLRIGIRPSREKKRKKANELVLKKITARERKILKNLFRRVMHSLNKDDKAHSAAGLRHNP